MRRLAAVVVGCVLVLSACSSGTASPSVSTAVAEPTPSARPVALTILGAASLKGALDEAKAAYETAHPGTTLAISTDSSTALETQIEQGAPADVFLSADEVNPKKLVDKTLTEGGPVTFAGNKLTVIVPTDNPGKIVAATDVGRPGVKVIAAGDKVPITKYATQLVANLSKGASDPAAFVAAYAKNIVSKEDNVAAVVSKIELGEGDAAIVYVTDAHGIEQGRDDRRARRRECPGHL